MICSSPPGKPEVVHGRLQVAHDLATSAHAPAHQRVADEAG